MGRVKDERHSELDIESAVCARIRSAVSAGGLPPGTKLPEELVAESFATSRARIRSAFLRLAFEGLVDLERNRGAFVARPSVKEAKELFEARRVIERVTTEIVTRTILTHDLRRLSRHIVESKPHWFRANRQVATRSVSAFHLSLAALAHNASLTTALERLIIRTSLILGLYVTGRTFAALPDPYETGLEFFQLPRPNVDVKRQMWMVG
jgi:DNA-binding GntR family transcriptional regulator